MIKKKIKSLIKRRKPKPTSGYGYPTDHDRLDHIVDYHIRLQDNQEKTDDRQK
jgi:hypothetical protein